MISQPELCGVILLWLDRQGVEGLSTRQLNVIAKAATEIVEALKEADSDRSVVDQSRTTGGTNG